MRHKIIGAPKKFAMYCTVPYLGLELNVHVIESQIHLVRRPFKLYILRKGKVKNGSFYCKAHGMFFIIIGIGYVLNINKTWGKSVTYLISFVHLIIVYKNFASTVSNQAYLQYIQCTEQWGRSSCILDFCRKWVQIWEFLSIGVILCQS